MKIIYKEMIETKKIQENWLITSAIMVIIMIFIGGLTRLSNAGLSIVEWKAVTGILPPLSESEWIIEFTKYQNSPEFKLINNDITINGFKEIFWLEFIHRLAARMTSAVICLPLIYFFISGIFSIKRDKKYFLLPILIGLQGVMGWYMVKSGLVDAPHVSHFRLASHLILAVILYHIIIHYLITLKNGPNLLNISIFDFIVIGMIYLQIFFGALVAGLKAGMIYNTFPLMGDSFIPQELLDCNGIYEILSDPASVQFIHRITAYILAIIIIIKAIWICTSNTIGSIVLLFILFTQIILGILTIIYIVPISIALMHQMGAMILLTITILTAEAQRIGPTHLAPK